MATYPTLKTSYGSDADPIKSIEIDRSEDGTARGRSTYAADKSTFKITHPSLDSTDKATLDAFYAANRLLEFGYTSPTDSATRSCIFAEPIKYKRLFGNYWDAEVMIEEV